MYKQCIEMTNCYSTVGHVSDYFFVQLPVDQDFTDPDKLASRLQQVSYCTDMSMVFLLSFKYQVKQIPKIFCDIINNFYCPLTQT